MATKHGGGITEISKGKYTINYRDELGVSRRKTIKAENLTEARKIKLNREREVEELKETKFRKEEEARVRQAKIDRGEYVEDSDEEKLLLCNTLDELAELFYSTRDTKDNKHEWNRYLSRVSPIIGNHSLPISYSGAKHLLTELKLVVSKQTGSKLSPKSINIIVSAVASMYKESIKLGRVKGANPFYDLPKEKVTNKKQRWLKESEIELLIDTVSGADVKRVVSGKPPSVDYKLMVTMAWSTGARPVSYLNLTLDDIDVVNRHDEDGVDYMKPNYIEFASVKKGAVYQVPISPKLLPILWKKLLELSEERNRMMGYKHIFPSSKYPKQAIAHATVGDYLQPILDTLFNKGVTDRAKKITPYTIRHSSASFMVAKLGNIHLAKKLLNHTSINTTMIYVDSDNEEMQGAVSIFN